MIQILVDTFVKQSSPQPVITVAPNLLNHKTRRAEKRGVTCQYSSLTTLSPVNFISTQNSLGVSGNHSNLYFSPLLLSVRAIPLATITGFTPVPSHVDITERVNPTVTAEPLRVKLGGKKATYIYLFIRTFARARAVIASIINFTNILGLRRIAMDSTAAHVKNQDRIVGGE
jgi:hypothetical protein